MRFDPYREIDRLFETAGAAGGWRGSVLAMDAYRDGDSFVVDFDLPGVDPDSIDLSVERDQLTVHAERRWGFEGRELVARERPQGTFTRTLFLGESLDADRIEADYDRGVLTLRIPVTEEAKPRKIQVGGQAALTS
ncbi:MAG TPA: Hsp20/alpha crystallin family protein [Acidimicrobiales bacterium]|nr:Hsp20/alpha crystallin family protein [Acidimicrobiales bacterium]